MSVLDWVLVGLTAVVAGSGFGVMGGMIYDYYRGLVGEKRHVTDVQNLYYTLPRPISATRSLQPNHVIIRQVWEDFHLLWQQAKRPVPALLVGPLFENAETWRFMMVSANAFTPACGAWRREARNTVVLETVVHINPENDVAMVDTRGAVLRSYLCTECKTYHRAWTRPWITDNSRMR